MIPLRKWARTLLPYATVFFVIGVSFIFYSTYTNNSYTTKLVPVLLWADSESDSTPNLKTEALVSSLTPIKDER